MLVKDWLRVVIPASNIKVVDGNLSAYGTKESLEDIQRIVTRELNRLNGIK